jgi:two-component system chemotaxis response regulator CheB
VRVVVVEDSLVQRTHLVRTLETEGDIAVVGEAVGAAQAIALVDELRPDVITLDLQIPDGGGQYAIEQIMARTPTPILVLSATLTSRESAPAVDALMAGALDAMPKPGRWTAAEEAIVRRRVRALRAVTVVRHHRGRVGAYVPRPDRPNCVPAAHRSDNGPCVVAIAASTGGPPALAEVLSGLAGLAASVLVVQHIHSDFVEGLVSWMQRVSALPVRLAVDGAKLERATVYIGPGEFHLRLGPNRRLVLASTPETIHRPSADELFQSIATHAGPAGIGVVLTGMGDDGASGLLAVRRAGGATIGQDEGSCAVFGMPRAAQRAGAIAEIVPLAQISRAITRATQTVAQ